MVYDFVFNYGRRFCCFCNVIGSYVFKIFLCFKEMNLCFLGKVENFL